MNPIGSFYEPLKGIWAFLLPLMLFGLTLGNSPAYYQPVLNNPVGIAVLVGMFLWNVAGYFLSMRLSGTFQKRIVTALFQAPLIMMIMLLPAMFTVWTALGR